MNIYEPENYNEHDWEVFGKWVKGVLITHTPTITFTKKDGTERIMKCTLKSDLLPAVEIKETKVPRKHNDKVMSVFDIESNAWKSFTINTVKRVEFALSDD